jgi:hypothetical protein
MYVKGLMIPPSTNNPPPPMDSRPVSVLPPPVVPVEAGSLDQPCNAIWVPINVEAAMIDRAGSSHGFFRSEVIELDWIGSDQMIAWLFFIA